MIKQLNYSLIVSALFWCCAPSTNSQVDVGSMPGKDLTPFGRSAVTNEHLELISSASHVGFSFQGKECQLYVTLPDWQDHNYLQYEIDGVYQKRIRVAKGTVPPIILSANSDGRHTVKVYKATEAHTGPILIQKVVGQNIKPVLPSTAPLIEFIGNSITCGAAADPSEVPCGKGEYHDQHNAYYAYGPRVARSLKANFILSCVSGIGIYRNWNSDGPTMPQVYEKTDFQHESTRLWDFAAYQPKVVSIALGTNDFSNGDGVKPRASFDSGAFVNNYIKFVQQVKAKYPAAQIALLSSPMINGEHRVLLQNCLLAVKEKIDQLHPGSLPVELHFFKPMQARGCTGHPSVEDHAILADELTPFFQKLLQ